MTKHITDTTRLTVVKHLASGKTPEITAAATKLDRHEVTRIGTCHGYPHLDKLARAAELLQAKIDREQREALPPVQREATERPAPARGQRPRPTAPTQRTPVSTPAQPASPATERKTESELEKPATGTSPTAGPVAGSGGSEPQVLTRPDEIRVVLNAGKQSPSKRVQNLTTRILDQVDRLRELLRAEEDKATAAREAAERKAALQRKRDQLEAQLEAVRAELKGGAGSKPARRTSASSPGGVAPAPQETQPTAAEIRSWARAEGIDCPDVGRIPNAVRAAHANAAAAPAGEPDERAAGQGEPTQGAA